MSLEDSNPTEFMEPPDDAIREQKGLLAINGVGVAVMLILFQVAWINNPAIVPALVYCIASFSFGLLLTGVLQFLRQKASPVFQTGRMAEFRRFRQCCLVAALLSLTAFIIGFGIVMFGVLRP
jgi:hypothetical protein